MLKYAKLNTLVLLVQADNLIGLIFEFVSGREASKKLYGQMFYIKPSTRTDDSEVTQYNLFTDTTK